jgi:hypothetical protein
MRRLPRRRDLGTKDLQRGHVSLGEGWERLDRVAQNFKEYLGPDPHRFTLNRGDSKATVGQLTDAVLAWCAAPNDNHVKVAVHRISPS